MELELTVNGVAGTVHLWQAHVPNTVEAFVRSLPLDATLKQCRWSGDACFTPLDSGPITDVDVLELPAVTIYPGTLVVRLAEDESPHAELLMGYGSAEHRWPDGPKPVTPIGEISASRKPILDQLRAVAATGPIPLTLRQT